MTLFPVKNPAKKSGKIGDTFSQVMKIFIFVFIKFCCDKNFNKNLDKN